MKEINDEIDITLNIMRTINNERITGEFQVHLAELLEIKRDEMRQRLNESKIEPTKPNIRVSSLFSNQNLNQSHRWLGTATTNETKE